MLLYQHLRSLNDENGNPRRLYLVFNEQGTLLNVINEGFSGIGALRDAGYEPKSMAELSELDIPIYQYLSLLAFSQYSDSDAKDLDPEIRAIIEDKYP